MSSACVWESVTVDLRLFCLAWAIPRLLPRGAKEGARLVIVHSHFSGAQDTPLFTAQCSVVNGCVPVAASRIFC